MLTADAIDAASCELFPALIDEDVVFGSDVRLGNCIKQGVKKC